jgi:ribosomal RNA assembly protein
MFLQVRIPHERIGVLIGPQGAVKRLIEEKGECNLQIDSRTGMVEIVDVTDSLKALRVRDVVLAIGRGFSPEKAICLLDDDALMLEIIDLSERVSSEKALRRINGRIIGAGGKMRERFEKLIGSSVSVYGKTVSILGYPEQNRVVHTGIEMLINGAPHGPVYSFLEKKHRELKQQEVDYYKREV